MTHRAQWLFDLGHATPGEPVDGLVPVDGYRPDGRAPEEVVMMEKAASYGARAVFFEAPHNGRPPVAQAFIFVSEGHADDPSFAELHRRLWSWGGVPLIYRRTSGLVQLFRCAHKPDFISASGERICKPIKTLRTVGNISEDPWWDASRLRNGTLWDDPAVCAEFLQANKAAHKCLIKAVKQLNSDLNDEGILRKRLRRKLLVLSLLIAYLEERGVFPQDYFAQFLGGATRFFQVLANGAALVKLLDALEERFNGHVFILDNEDRDSLSGSTQLARFARLVEAKQEASGQLTLWQLYSFKDLPVELISHIYQLFVDADSSVYTPPFLVRLILDEALSWERLERLHKKDEIILDPACGSGVFLVEAYKRLVIHWRSRNAWKRPSIAVLKSLLKKVHGVDSDEGAVELAAFSLCLALCDSLEPETIRASIQLFPPLVGKTIHYSCFFEAKEKGVLKDTIGVVVGNPPFQSTLHTPGAERSYERYVGTYGPLPDKQLAYLFLHEAMDMVAQGGVLSMLQQYNFLCNQQSLDFRRNFFTQWDVREILDFISVRGLFHKGGADTKVIVVVAEAAKPRVDRKILHATFRRSGRVDAEQGFDIDYYDLHWLPRELILKNDDVWSTDLLGGGRMTEFVTRLKTYRTVGQYVSEQRWDYGEGFIFGNPSDGKPASHVVGKAFVPASALSDSGIDTKAIGIVPKRPIQRPRRKEIFSPPLLLVHKQMTLNHGLWKKGYLTYTHEVLGISAAKGGATNLERLNSWLTRSNRALQAFVAGASACLAASKATAILSGDILSVPYPKTESLDLSPNEQILIDDIVDYYRDLIRLGESSTAMKIQGHSALSQFTNVFIRQINAIYKKKPLQVLDPQIWPGIICQPFVFGRGRVDWSGADELRGKLDALLKKKQGTTIQVTRIARIYDDSFVFLLKPDRLRYWLRSVALRDADETLADLRAQGF